MFIQHSKGDMIRLFWVKAFDKSFKPKTKEERQLVKLYEVFSKKYYNPNLSEIDNREVIAGVIYQKLKERRRKEMFKNKPTVMELVAPITLVVVAVVLLFITLY